MNIEDFIRKYHADFIRIRRELHQCAELSTLEYETGKILLHYLTKWNISYQYPVAETGIVATIFGKASSNLSATPKVVALRADMDALPIYEDPHRPFSSKNPGVMHACGHDAHMAIALGAALYFKRNESLFSGCIKIFFQPAEETIGGAQRMIDEGCMKHPDVDYVIGLHVAPYLETGDIELKYGNLYAASDEIYLQLSGKSCHGAYPDTGVDAIVMSSMVISSLQSIVSRNVSPTDSCVLSLGTIHGGTAHNILADSVEITGALRTTNPQSRSLVKEHIHSHVEHICKAFGGTGTVRFTPGYDALQNTDTLVDLLAETALPILGKSHIYWKPTPGMGVEDFSAFLSKAPGVFYHLGCGKKENGFPAPLHSRDFTLDEESIAIGIHLQVALATALLNT